MSGLGRLRHRARTIATLVVMGGLIATAAGVQATAASWTDSVDFAAEVRAATTTTSTTSTTTTSTTSTSSTSTTTTEPPTTTTTPPPTTTSSTTSTSTTSTTSSTTSTTSTTSSTSSTSTTTTTLPPTTTTPPSPSVDNGGIGAANQNTVIADIDWEINSARQVCTVAHVTGIDDTPRDWAIRVNLDAPPWYGMPANQVNLNGTGTRVIESPSSVLITGRTHGGGWDPRTNNTPITSSQAALITICSYNNPVPPPADPSWYTVTTTPGTEADGSWTDRKACYVVTATTTRNNLVTHPYFYGWRTDIDLTAAKARITDAGNTLNYVSWSPYANGETDFWASPQTYNPPQDRYAIRSGFNLALRAAGGGHDSASLTVCVHGYST